MALSTIKTNSLDNLAVTNAKIANTTIENGKIANSTIATGKLAFTAKEVGKESIWVPATAIDCFSLINSPSISDLWTIGIDNFFASINSGFFSVIADE